jgi:hypothetical protein
MTTSSTLSTVIPPPQPIECVPSAIDSHTSETSSIYPESVNTLAHRIKWSFIRKKEWHKLRKIRKEREEKEIEEELDTDLLYSGELTYLSQIVPCRITRKQFIIGRYDRDVHIILNIKKEVYCVSKDKNAPNSFHLYALINQHQRTEFNFSAVVSNIPLEQQVINWVGFLNMSIYGLLQPYDQLPSRRILVVINPAAGGMTGEAQFENWCKPILEDAVRSEQLTYQVLYTSKEEKGSDIVKKLENLEDWDVIAAGGGDGALHDCLTGLLERDDWETAIKKPLCPLAMGTSNAMANSLYGSKHQISRSTMALVKGFIRPMDMCTVLQSDGKRYFSFLTVMFGFLANVTRMFLFLTFITFVNR